MMISDICRVNGINSHKPFPQASITCRRARRSESDAGDDHDDRRDEREDESIGHPTLGPISQGERHAGENARLLRRVGALCGTRVRARHEGVTLAHVLTVVSDHWLGAGPINAEVLFTTWPMSESLILHLRGESRPREAPSFLPSASIPSERAASYDHGPELFFIGKDLEGYRSSGFAELHYLDGGAHRVLPRRLTFSHPSYIGSLREPEKSLLQSCGLLSSVDDLVRKGALGEAIKISSFVKTEGRNEELPRSVKP